MNNSTPNVEYKGNRRWQCYVYGMKTITGCRKCGNSSLSLKAIPHHGRSAVHYNVRKCEECGIYYLSYKV